MSSRNAVIDAVSKLDYRVTVGDVAAQSGLELASAQRELLSLASAVGGHLQVTESGEIAYKFPPDMRGILVRKSWQAQLQAWLQQAWKWIFYLIRLSFGVLLIAFIVIVVVAIVVALIALQSRSGDRDDRDRDSSSSSGGGGFVFFPDVWVWGNPFTVFDPDYYEPRRQQAREESGMNFLESVFSFLFGDGNPNRDREERRLREIASVIRNNGGVAIAEQLAPYLDDVPAPTDDSEDYVLPVLVKFNGYPQVSDRGTLAYTFPDLLRVARQRQEAVGTSFVEHPWQFSKASGGQIALAIGLGVFYLVAAIVLGGLLAQLPPTDITGYLGWVASIYPVLLGYAIAFVTVPCVRYFVLQVLNRKIEARNRQRAQRAERLLRPTPDLQEKLAFAQQFASTQQVIGESDLAYTTETDLAEQEYRRLLQETIDEH